MRINLWIATACIMLVLNIFYFIITMEPTYLIFIGIPIVIISIEGKSEYYLIKYKDKKIEGISDLRDESDRDGSPFGPPANARRDCGSESAQRGRRRVSDQAGRQHHDRYARGAQGSSGGVEC